MTLRRARRLQKLLKHPKLPKRRKRASQQKPLKRQSRQEWYKAARRLSQRSLQRLVYLLFPECRPFPLFRQPQVFRQCPPCQRYLLFPAAISAFAGPAPSSTT
jgi:hypothetical protein